MIKYSDVTDSKSWQIMWGLTRCLPVEPRRVISTRQLTTTTKCTKGVQVEYVLIGGAVKQLAEDILSGVDSSP